MSNVTTPTTRIAAIDIARGLALIAMTIYHFSWDLEFFGWSLPGTIQQTGWVLFARCIATSFLFLVGVSLYLAHGEQIKWRSFWNRWMLVAGAAVLISIATYFAIPDDFIFFGILHAIALFSLVGLAFLRLPWWLTVAVAAIVFVSSEPLRNNVFDAPIFWWSGLSAIQPQSNDYVPLFPWLSATLFGLGTAQLASNFLLFAKLKGRFSGGWADRSIGFIGRHSLLYYMVHQPVMLACLWVFTNVMGPPDRTPAFLNGCQRTCTQTNEANFCEKFCSCTADGLKREKLFTPFFDGEVDLATNSKAQAVIRQCSAP